jgi:hypothetical protein
MDKAYRMEELNEWKIYRHVGPGDVKTANGSVYFDARVKGENIQKRIEQVIYESPYETPLAQWQETLSNAADDLIEPQITVRSFDGGSHHGFYEGPSSETTVAGWVEALTPAEKEAVLKRVRS